MASEEDNEHQTIPTSAITFVETEHGRLRRKQRGIHKKDLQAAKKYGTRMYGHPRPNGDPTSKYTWNGIVYITNDYSGEEVTSYALPIALKKIPISSEMQYDHDEAVRTIREDKTQWLSNTVIVVDTSGSMKKSDVWDTRNRLDSVWLSVALDFIASRIESGSAGGMDVISILSMGDYATPLIKEQPTTWVLYNDIVNFYTNKTISPFRHGNYIPSLDLAEELLTSNSNESCAMGLCFISDGRPSDHMLYQVDKYQCNEMIMDRVAKLAKRFGRRMQFDAVGIGSDESFDTLQGMVDEAEDFGVKASMRLPSSSSSALGDVLHSFASSITSTQTEMTDMCTMKQQRIRNVQRESRIKASLSITQVTHEDFFIYERADVRRMVYEEIYQDGKGYRGSFQLAELQHSDADCVAFNRGPFGEGAERFAYRFYEVLGDQRTIVGKPLVAKESRYIIEDDLGDEKSRMKFVQTFCRTQQLAGRIAKEFNEKLDVLCRVDGKTPRVEFLDCCVYQMNDINLGRLSVLVEEKIDQSKWKKWNANNGFVEGMKEVPAFNDRDLQNAMRSMQNLDLNILEEEDEDEDEDEDRNGDSEDEMFEGHTHVPSIIFSPSEVAQAFSHFSYWATGRKRLVCDIQGVFCEEVNKLRLSDPVIHYYNSQKDSRKMVHGRTDRGRKGFAMFFETHKCSKLCHLVTMGFKRAARHKF